MNQLVAGFWEGVMSPAFEFKPSPAKDFTYPQPVDPPPPLSQNSSTFSEEGTMGQLMSLMSMFMESGYTPPPPPMHAPAPV